MKAAPPAVTVSAPATVANLGPGYDVLGLAISSPCDTVVARKRDEFGVTTECRWKGARKDAPASSVTDPPNTAYVAASHLLEHLNLSWGVELVVEKGMPVGSGLGSSGASAVAAAIAVNELAGSPLRREELLPSCVEAERQACGSAHADNVAAGLLGGIVLVGPDAEPVRIHTELDLWLAMVTPDIELLTRDARNAIPRELPCAEATANGAHLAALIYGLATNDALLVRRASRDFIAEPRRARLIPGFPDVKEAALARGALSSSISGAGPSIFALCLGEQSARAVVAAMSAALDRRGAARDAWVSPVNWQGPIITPLAKS